SQKIILARIKDERHQQIANARSLSYEDFIELCELPELTHADKYAVSKYRLMKAYNITTPDIVTPEWVKDYDNEKEKSVYKNLCSLYTTNSTTLEDRLEAVRQREEARLGLCPKTKVHHNLEGSRYVKLQYAADIMTSCGFTDVFASNTVQAQTLKEGIRRIWEGVLKEMDNTRTALDRKKPTHNNWIFKHQLGYLNNILHDVLGVKIVGVNKRCAKYHLVHYSKVASLRQMSFDI
ncbi:hypothetical protein BX616_008636, partial [Lobosporangium transversale]